MAKLDLKTKSEKELQELLAAKRVDLVNAHKSLAAGELPNTRVVNNTKGEIAQILTTLNDPSRTAKKEA